MESTYEDCSRNRNFDPTHSIESHREFTRSFKIDLRKQWRDEEITKRRKIPPFCQAPTFLPNTPHPDSTFLPDASDPDLMLLLYKLINGSTDQREDSARKIREMSSKNNLSIKYLIENGLISSIKDLLSSEIPRSLQYELCWILTNLSFIDAEYSEIIMELEIYLLLPKVISDIKVKEQAAWVVGNIAAEEINYRNMILDSKCFEMIVEVIQQTNESSVTEIGVWALSNIFRAKPLPKSKNIKKAFLVFAEVIQRSKVLDILSDCLWGISIITETHSDLYRVLIQSNVCKKLVEFIVSRHYDIQLPAIKVVGNILSGDSQQTDLMVASGAIEALHSELHSKKANIQKEVVFAFSNLSASTVQHIEKLISSNVYDSLIELALCSDTKIFNDLTWALSNCTASTNPKQLSLLIKSGLIQALCNLLKCPNPNSCYIILLGLEKILEKGNDYFQKCHTNEFINIIESCGGDKIIDQLSLNDCSSISKKADFLIKKFFSTDYEDKEIMAPTLKMQEFGF